VNPDEGGKGLAASEEAAAVTHFLCPYRSR